MTMSNSIRATNGVALPTGWKQASDTTKPTQGGHTVRRGNADAPGRTAPAALKTPLASSRGQVSSGGANAAPVLGRAHDAELAELSSSFKDVSGLPSPSQARQNTEQALQVSSEASDIMSDSGTTLDEQRAIFRELKGKSADLGQSSEAMRSSGHDAIRAVVDFKKAEVDARLADIEKSLADAPSGGSSSTRPDRMDPLSKKAALNAKSFTTDGAIRIIDREIQKLGADGPSQDKRAKLLDAKAFLLERREELRSADHDNTPLETEALDALMGSKKTNHGIESKSAKREILAGLREPGQGGVKFELPLSHPEIREEGMMELFLGRVFEDAGVDGPPKLDKSLATARSESLNAQPWKPIHGTVDLRLGGADVKLDSTIRPQSDLGPTYEDLNGGGVNCHMAQSYTNVANLAVTSAKVGGETVFEGIRHGTLTAYNISAKGLKDLSAQDPAAFRKMVDDLLPKSLHKTEGGTVNRLLTALHIRDKGTPDLDSTIERMKSSKSFRQQAANAMRTQATRNRALDIVKSALIADPKQRQDAIDGKMPTVKLSSISLLTPEAIRSLGGLADSKGSNERLMLQDQFGAWDAISGKKWTFDIKGEDGSPHRVTVEVDALAFNFGVNQGAVNKLGVKKFGTYIGVNPSTAEALSGWKLANAKNAESIERLTGPGGMVDEWLRDSSATDVEKDQVRALRSQVRDIWDDKSYQSQGREPYKIVSRLAVLTDMIGNNACWNCKSGKDRTGECDVEAKYLAAQLHHARQNGSSDVPAYGRARSDDEKQNLFNMAVDGGNHEIQTLNTGAPGFKLGGVPDLGKLYGTNVKDEVYRTFMGQSKYFGS